MPTRDISFWERSTSATNEMLSGCDHKTAVKIPWKPSENLSTLGYYDTAAVLSKLSLQHT
jgi:hypothetical protein